VSNYFTIAGYLGKVNPFISATLEAAGIDPSKGSQDLYPDISINPITGTLQPKNPNVFGSLIQNVIPQTQVISALIGRNQDFRSILQANPEAAAQYLRGSLGLSSLFRNVNLPQEAFKYEVQRESAQDSIRNQALRTGDWARAERMPALQPFFAKLKQLLASNPDLMAHYQAATKQDSTATFFDALMQGNLPVG
jgi:hypothetical protein